MHGQRTTNPTLISPAAQNIMDIVTLVYHLLLLGVLTGCFHAFCLSVVRIFLALQADFVHGQHNQFLEKTLVLKNLASLCAYGDSGGEKHKDGEGREKPAPICTGPFSDLGYLKQNGSFSSQV